MRRTTMFLEGVSVLFLAYAPVNVGAALFADGAPAVPDEASVVGRGLAEPMPFGASADVTDPVPGLPAESGIVPQKAVNGYDPPPTSPPAEKSLIEHGYAQAREAAARQLQRGLQWVGGILAGAGLCAAVGFLVWRRQSRPRAKPVVRLLMLPSAYSVPPEPPVPTALPQPDAATRQKMRSAA